MDLVNKLTLENGGRLFACVAAREEYPQHYKDAQSHFELKNVYMGSPGPYESAGCRWSNNQANIGVYGVGRD